MAVLQMKRINICALKKDRKPVLELLQRRGAVEVDSVLPEDSVFSRTDTSANRSVFQKTSPLPRLRWRFWANTRRRKNPCSPR